MISERKVRALIEKGGRLVIRGNEYVNRARKAAVPAVAALGLIVGTDSPTYVNAVAILVTLGVYAIPNAKPR